MTITINKKQAIKVKPTTKKEIIRISNNLKYKIDLTIERLVNGLNKGVVFSPAIFNGTRSNDNWVSQQLFGLDFDSGFTPEEAIERLELYSLEAQIIYATFSDSKVKRKFRLLFALDTVITSLNERDSIINGLLELFPEADKAVRDAARLFYPGKEILSYSTEYLSYEQLKEVLDYVAPDRDKVAHIRPKLAKLTYSSTYTEEALKLVANYIKKHNLRFVAGERHSFTIRVAAVCNQFGIPEDDCFNALVNSGNSSKHTRAKIKDIYSRYSSQYGCKDATNDLRPSRVLKSKSLTRMREYYNVAS